MESAPATYFLRRGNTIFVCSSVDPSDTPSSEYLLERLCDEYKLDVVELGLKKMNDDAENRVEELQTRLDNGENLNDVDSAWFHKNHYYADEENLVNKFLMSEESRPERIGKDEKNLLDRLAEVGLEVLSKKPGGSRRVSSLGKKIGRPSKDDRAKRHEASPYIPKTRVQATVNQKITILDWHHAQKKPCQTATARHFQSIFPELNIKQPLICEWIKNEEKIRQQPPDAFGGRKRLRDAKFPEVEALLEKWIGQAILAKFHLSEMMIKEKWADFARILKIPSAEWIRRSNGWVGNFKAKLGLRTFVRHGEAGVVDQDAVTAEHKRLIEVINQYHPKDVFNMDETGLFYAMPPDRELANASSHGLKSVKNRLTLALTCNALGTEKLDPLFIGKYRKPRCFKGKLGSELGFDYYHNSDAWMNHMIFQDWIDKLNLKFVSEQRHVLLLLDDFPGHLLPPATLSNVKVEFLKPNMTSHIQPLDAGIIRNFKSNYRSRYVGRALRRLDDGSRDTSSMFAIDQLAAMNLAIKAWQVISPAFIRNCWMHAGLIDLSRLRLFDDTIKPDLSPVINPDLQNQMDELETRGIVSQINRMSIENLLNPVGEDEYCCELKSPQEIYEQSLQDAREAAEEEDGRDHQQEPASEKIPSTLEAIGHINWLLSYLESDHSAFADTVTDALLQLSAHLRAKENLNV